ncbi:hypothetical protein AB0F16_37720 [Streptomyces tanashiensis]|uniref:hypothetical protein n=1 Tax=Streptomyces tanashiensis TaxID=67367 RepID=UPI0034117300
MALRSARRACFFDSPYCPVFVDRRERSSALARPRRFFASFSSRARSASVRTISEETAVPVEGARFAGKDTTDRLETLPSTPPMRSSPAACCRIRRTDGEA